MRTLAVWYPDWPVVAAGYSAADPVVVVEANVVVACSAAARAFGVQTGLRRREAQARCPEAEVLAADPGRDARAFEPLVVAVEAFGPAVEIVRPGVCALPTRGPSRYFGGDDALVARVGEAVAGARVGVADGPFAAILAARRSRVVPPGQSAAFLALLPVAVLGDPDLADLLRRLGLRTLGDLARLDAAAVLGRFGPAGARAHRLARGLDERPLEARVPPPDLAVTVELDPPVERVDAAAFAAKTLADELTARLAARGLACARIRVEAETEHGESLVRLWRHDGALTATAMAERVRWQLDGWLSTGTTTAGLTMLRLAPDEVHPDDGHQLGFWGSPAADDRVGRALARVQGLLGHEAVTLAVIDGGRGPGDQVTLVPWGDPLAPEHPADAPWPGALPSPSPATVHPQPVPAEVVDEDGAPVGVGGRGLASAAPVRLSVSGDRWTEVVAWAGPWPVEERWWDPRARRRRARWQVTTAAGAAHLLSLEGGRWSVEATYD